VRAARIQHLLKQTGINFSPSFKPALICWTWIVVKEKRQPSHRGPQLDVNAPYACLEAGLVTPATVADHIEPHRATSPRSA
jgi:hypothetical protein